MEAGYPKENNAASAEMRAATAMTKPLVRHENVGLVKFGQSEMSCDRRTFFVAES